MWGGSIGRTAPSLRRHANNEAAAYRSAMHVVGTRHDGSESCRRLQTEQRCASARIRWAFAARCPRTESNCRQQWHVEVPYSSTMRAGRQIYSWPATSGQQPSFAENDVMPTRALKAERSGYVSRAICPSSDSTTSTEAGPYATEPDDDPGATGANRSAPGMCSGSHLAGDKPSCITRSPTRCSSVVNRLPPPRTGRRHPRNVIQMAALFSLPPAISLRRDRRSGRYRRCDHEPFGSGRRRDFGTAVD